LPTISCDQELRIFCLLILISDSMLTMCLLLLALQSDESEFDVIGAPYSKKCIAWEKIKLAVDKGAADVDPNALEQFVGDYVFNPVAGTTEIPIGKPVEVMEIGTGFMMIRRKTFEKFGKAFPEYMYKPDHVRTEAFDGSREIMQFFQAEIDRTNFEKEYRKIFDKIKKATDLKQVEDIINQTLTQKDNRSKRYLSEDYWFCQRVRDLGLKIYYCPWMQLQHVGNYVFGGSLAALAQIGASATADLSQIRKKKI
jgi:hypothetical protein